MNIKKALPLQKLLKDKKEKTLIHEILNGSSSKYSELIKLNKKRIESLGMSFFHNSTDTEDFTQEVFIKAYQNLKSFKANSSFSTWITRIAYNLAINTIERRKENETLKNEEKITNCDYEPENEHIKTITIQAVREAVKELEPKYELCINLYFFNNYSYDEISKITDINTNTIKSHIFRAKKILYQKLIEFKD